jgi:hypothetical protein
MINRYQQINTINTIILQKGLKQQRYDRYVRPETVC